MIVRRLEVTFKKTKKEEGWRDAGVCSELTPAECVKT